MHQENIKQSPADMEGAYRFIRNEHVSSVDAIAEAGYQVAVKQVVRHNLLLALEDTTAITHSHRSVRDELGRVNQGNRYRGMFAHSVLLFTRAARSC